MCAYAFRKLSACCGSNISDSKFGKVIRLILGHMSRSTTTHQLSIDYPLIQSCLETLKGAVANRVSPDQVPRKAYDQGLHCLP